MIPYQFSKEEIQSRNFDNIDTILNVVGQVGKGASESVLLGCTGYDDTPEALYDIPEVRNYIQEIFERYPHILYFLYKNDGASFWIDACMGSTHSFNLKNKYSKSKLIEKFGSIDRVPPEAISILFDKPYVANMLKQTISYGRRNKDWRGAMSIVIRFGRNYMLDFHILEDAGVREEHLHELGFME